jgi:hypothetical protein
MKIHQVRTLSPGDSTGSSTLYLIDSGTRWIRRRTDEKIGRSSSHPRRTATSRSWLVIEAADFAFYWRFRLNYPYILLLGNFFDARSRTPYIIRIRIRTRLTQRVLSNNLLSSKDYYLFALFRYMRHPFGTDLDDSPNS